jgi:hypothetical protein
MNPNRRRAATLIAMGLLGLQACRPASAPMPTLTSLFPTNTEPVPTATLTPVPSDTPTLEPSATPTPEPTRPPVMPEVSAKGEGALCYFGPGTDYSVEGKFPAGTSEPVLGRDDSSTWVQIAHPALERRFCWLQVADLNLAGDLPLAEVVPAPAAIVSMIAVSLRPSKVSVACSDLPYKFKVKFTITTTGPTTVTYQRTKTGGKYKEEVESTTFSAAGTKTFETNYTVESTGEATYRVRSLTPNELVGEDTARLSCSP